MGIAITVTFPCSDAEWNKLVSIRALLSGQEKQSSIEELSDNESQVLGAIASAEEDDETPTLDFLEGMGVGKLSGSARFMMESYMDEHPSATCAQAVKEIISEYPNIHKPALQQAFYHCRIKTSKNLDRVYAEGSLRKAVKQHMIANPNQCCNDVVGEILKKYPFANKHTATIYFYQVHSEFGIGGMILYTHQQLDMPIEQHHS